MRHGVGQGALQQHLGRDPSKLRPSIQMPRQVGQRLVEMRYRGREVGQHGRTVCAADEERSRVPQDAVHVADHLMRGANLVGDSEVREIRRRAA